MIGMDFNPFYQGKEAKIHRIGPFKKLVVIIKLTHMGRVSLPIPRACRKVKNDEFQPNQKIFLKFRWYETNLQIQLKNSRSR